MNEMLIPNARLYAARHQLELAEALGSGKDGIVLVARHKTKPGDVAIKALRFNEGYLREKHAYQRLATMAITAVSGFSVPELLGSDDDLRVLEMTIVKRPFVLDFAGAYLDVRPEFPEDVWADWETEKREQFEARWPATQEVLAEFEALGIYQPASGLIGILGLRSQGSPRARLRPTSAWPARATLGWRMERRWRSLEFGHLPGLRRKLCRNDCRKPPRQSFRRSFRQRNAKARFKMSELQGTPLAFGRRWLPMTSGVSTRTLRP